MSNVGGTCSFTKMCTDCLFCLWSKGMVEVVAENYHNIWAKKKKSDLGSRGDLLMKSIIKTGKYLQNREEEQYACVGGCKVLVAVLICACEHMRVPASPVLTK